MALNRVHPQNENFAMTSAHLREASGVQLKSYHATIFAADTLQAKLHRDNVAHQCWIWGA